MKISDVRTYPVKSPTPGRGGPGFLFVKLTTDSGVEGIGEIYCTAFSPFVGGSIAEEVCDTLVIDADYVFVTAGRSDAFSDSIDMLHKYGTSVILGMPPDDDRMFSVDSHLLTTGRKVYGSKLGDTCIKDDIPNLISLYQQGKLKLDELVSSTFPLSEINDAIESAERGEALRNVIVFD